MVVVEKERPGRTALIAVVGGCLVVVAFLVGRATAPAPQSSAAATDPLPTTTPAAPNPGGTSPPAADPTTLVPSAPFVPGTTIVGPSDERFVIRGAMFGPFEVGTTVRELERANPDAVVPDVLTSAPCFSVDGPWGVAVLAVPADGSADPRDAVVTQVSVGGGGDHPSSGWHTESGLAPGVTIGSTMDDVLARYGSVSLAPAEPGDGWLATVDGYEGGRLRLDLSDARIVTGIDLSLPDGPWFVEGCIG